MKYDRESNDRKAAYLGNLPCSRCGERYAVNAGPLLCEPCYVGGGKATGSGHYLMQSTIAELAAAGSEPLTGFVMRCPGAHQHDDGKTAFRVHATGCCAWFHDLPEDEQQRIGLRVPARVAIPVPNDLGGF